MLSGRDLLTLGDLTGEEVRQVLDVAGEQKATVSSGGQLPCLLGKSAALVFLKPSIRTRVSFEVACTRLGVTPVVLGPGDAFSRNETVADTTRCLERYCDAIIVRAFEQAMLEEIADVADVPVINALSDDYHPCQGLADLLTIAEHKGDPSDVTLAYVGDGNNVCATLMMAGGLTGMDVRAATPEGFEPSETVLARAKALSAATGADVRVLRDPAEAVAGADVVYTDTWASMGQEEEHAKRVAAFKGYSVDSDLMAAAAPGAVFMHCLPAHRGEEVTDEVIEAPYSIVFDQAENRLHAQQALLSLVMG